MVFTGQLVKAGLYFGSERLRGKVASFYVKFALQQLVRNGPGVHRALVNLEPSTNIILKICFIYSSEELVQLLKMLSNGKIVSVKNFIFDCS